MNVKDFKSTAQSFVLTKGGPELSKTLKERNIPNSPGVYLFEQTGEIIYIGKAGTFGEGGIWAEQGIRDRLKNKQSAKGTRDRMSRSKFFFDLIRERKAPIKVYWLETCKHGTAPATTENFPALVEAELLADFVLNNNNMLPRENNNF